MTNVELFPILPAASLLYSEPELNIVLWAFVRKLRVGRCERLARAGVVFLHEDGFLELKLKLVNTREMLNVLNPKHRVAWLSGSFTSTHDDFFPASHLTCSHCSLKLNPCVLQHRFLPR